MLGLHTHQPAGQETTLPTVSNTMTCPGCGESVSMDMNICAYCRRKITFTSVKDVRGMSATDSMKFLRAYKDALATNPNHPAVQMSLGLMQFDRGDYANALSAFDAAVSHGSDDPETYFYRAVSRFRATKPIHIKVTEAKELLELLDIAISMNPLPQYNYVKAYLIRRLIEKKGIAYRETSSDAMAAARAEHLSDADIADMDALLTT